MISILSIVAIFYHCLISVISSDQPQLPPQTVIQHLNSSLHHHHHVSDIKYQQPINRAPAPIPNKHRVYYQWDHKLNVFQQLYLELPPTSPYLSNPRFFREYSPVNATHPAKDYSQGQWPLLMELFAGKSNGIYIDLATNAWQVGSNTAGLDEFYNWTGICIEPLEMYREGILSNRKCTLVASPVFYENNVMVQFHQEEGLSGIVANGFDNAKKRVNNVELATVTLNSILDTFFVRNSPNSVIPSSHIHRSHHANGHRVIDYFSLDIEGAEYDAMKDFDFERTLFLVISVERPKANIHDLFVRQGYWFLANVIPANSNPFGEAIYLHYTSPRFISLMNKYRPNPQLKYNHQYRDWNPTYLLTPSWPPEDIAKMNANATSTSTKESAAAKAHHLRSIFEKIRKQYSTGSV